MSFSKVKGSNTPNNALLIPNNLSDVANANTSLNNILPSQTGNNGKALVTNGSNTSWQTIQLDEITINQVGHGFAANDYITYDKNVTSWVRANASGDNSGAVATVLSVIDADNFVLKSFGRIVDYTGTAGDYYYVDENGTGFLTNTQPLNRVQEALFAIPNNKAIAVNRPSQINLQNTVYVTFNGNDVTGNGSITKPYKTIQTAIDNSQANSTIMIDTGNYVEDVTITDGIHLKASSYHSVTVVGKLTINQTVNNNAIMFEGINFLNNANHTIDYISTNAHETAFYECNITQNGTGAFHALNVMATVGNFSGKNLQTSASISTGGSRAIYTSNTCTVGFTFFDALTGVEDNADNVAIELNGTGSFIYVGKNINGQTIAQGDGLTLLAYGGLNTNTVPVLVTTQATQPCIISSASIITNASPCVTGTGLFLYCNIFFFNNAYLDYANTLSGGSGAIALKSDNALSLRYRNGVSGLTATNIQDAIDEIVSSIGVRTLAVNQIAHGFAVNDEIMYDKTTSSYLKANTTGIYAVGTIAKVKTVVDADNFILYASGNIITRTGLTAGEFYYAKDDGTGGITLTPPTNVIQAVLFALPSNKAIELQYPAVTPSSTPTGIMPIGSELFFENSNPDTPVPSTEFVQANGQVIADPLSPYNGKRIRNLNGATITGVSILAVDDVLKKINVSLNDIYAFMIGDSLSIDIGVPNAVIKSVNYATGEIEIGDATSWSSGAFGLTTSSLAGAALFDCVGLKRFTRGNSANTGNGDINTLQGFRMAINSYSGSATAPNGFYKGDNIYEGTSYFSPISDGVNGTPRISNDTNPNYADGVWLKKIK